MKTLRLGMNGVVAKKTACTNQMRSGAVGAVLMERSRSAHVADCQQLSAARKDSLPVDAGCHEAEFKESAAQSHVAQTPITSLAR